MRRLPTLAAAALVTLVSTCTLLVSTAHARSNVQFGIEQFGRMEVPASGNVLLDGEQQAGARIIRYTLRWDWISKCDAEAAGNAADPGNRCYDWGYNDTVLAGAQQRGMKVLLSVYGTPKWMFDNRENYTGTSTAEYNRFVATYADFVQAAATRYDGRHGQVRVDQWTIWNESNGSFFQPRMVSGQMVGPARYAALYDASARRIKAVDPTMQVAVGPTAPHVVALPAVTWAKAVAPLLAKWGSPVDAWAHNGYTGSESPFHSTVKSPFVGLGNLGDLTRVMDAYSATRGKPLWITEFGYQTGGAQKAVDQAGQAKLMSDALYYAWLHPRVTTFIWYSLMDDEDTGDVTSFMSGLYGPWSQRCGTSLCPKPALGVYQHSLWLSGRLSNGLVTMWGQGRVAPTQTKIYVKQPGKGWQAFANADTQQTGTVWVRAALPVGTVVMTCDTSCGPAQTVAAAGGGTSGAKILKLKSVTLPKAATLRMGIVYTVACAQGCTVKVSVKRGRSAVGIARVTTMRGGRRVLVTFTARGRRALAAARRPVVVLRTDTRYSDGSRIVSDRGVVLR